MILNPYSRAVIFDDEPEKIAPILKLFEKHLVPQLYINFSKAPEEKNEESKLKNIRLIFTDFIKTGVSQGNPESQLTSIINAITSTISLENGPMLIVTWSAHSNRLLGSFKKILKEAGYIFETIMLEKEKYLENPNIESMLEDINEKLNHKEDFLRLLKWENKIKMSASTIISPFSNLGQRQRTQIIEKLSKASLGSAFNTSQSNLEKGFYNTMTNLLYDEMEKNIYVSDSENRIEDDSLIADDIAYLNTKLMIDKSISGNDSNYPSNVYPYKSFSDVCDSKHESLHDVCGFRLDELKESLFTREHLDTIEDESLDMICIEISPYCDHAQQNMKKAKLITGFILSEEQKVKTKSKSDFIYLGNENQFFLKNNTEKSYLCLSFRHVFRVNPEFTNELIPLFRLRKEMVNEIQHQTAFYLSRPGLTTLYN